MIFILKIILVHINFYLLFLKVVRGCWVNPFVKKDPITPDILQRIIAVFGDRNEISKLKICVLFLLRFSGFLRYSELSNIKMNNLEFQDAHVKITIAKSKTDMYRIGSSVIITKTDNDLCPVFWLKRYIELTDLKYNSDEYIFRSLSFF
jgi:integrase